MLVYAIGIVVVIVVLISASLAHSVVVDIHIGL